jgi:cephalosporin hydroxylase
MRDFIKRFSNRYKRLRKGYENPVRGISCSEFEVDNWIISDFIISELIPVVGVRPYPLEELCLMTGAVCRLRPTHLFEWGTNLGKSARIFYEISHNFNIQMDINSIDLPDDVEHIEHPGQKRGVLVKGIKKVKLHQGDGLSVSLNICKNILGDKHLLFFLDGDHSYETVKHELIEIIKAVPEANILLHDTFFQSSSSGYNTGPYRAINDVLMEFPNIYSALSTKLGLPGMTLLWHTGKD